MYMINFILYKISAHCLKQYIINNCDEKYFKDYYRPCNLPIGSILKYSSNVIYIII
jgi:hypothetical protein